MRRHGQNKTKGIQIMKKINPNWWAAAAFSVFFFSGLICEWLA
jgi:hypothetical protein